MDKWQCQRCDYVYDPQYGDSDNNIEAGTDYDDLPKKWRCPRCGVPKVRFMPYDDEITEWEE